MVRPVLPSLIFFGYVAVAPGTSFAQQEPCEIRIVDEKGLPISLAEVKTSTVSGTIDVLSNDDGRAILDLSHSVSPKQIHVTVSAVGYKDGFGDLDRTASRKFIIKLNEVTANQDDIVVVAKRISRPFSPKTIDFLDIITDPRAAADPVLAVNDLPASTNVTGNSHLTLRGSRESINRAYLNNVPVYEFSSGSEVDTSTENRSVFNLVVANEVETYPGNPPTYLSGATGGVIRVVTPDNKISGTTLSLTTLGASGGHVFASRSGNNFVALFGSLTDIGLYRKMNPSLDSIYGSLRSATGGALVHLTADNGGSITVLTQGETARDSFPFELYGTKQYFRLRPTKGRAVVSGTTPLAGFVFTTNIAFTRSDITEDFDQSNVQSKNFYGFGSLDAAHSWLHGKLRVRLGTDLELIQQISNTPLTTVGNPGSVQSSSDKEHSSLQQMTGYVFASYRQNDWLMFSVGARLPLAWNIDTRCSSQTSTTLSTPDKRNKLIISIGRYGGFETPTRAYYGRITPSLSRQIDVDYSWKMRSNTFGLSAFAAREQIYGKPFDDRSLFISNDVDNLTGISRLTKTQGLEAYATWTPVAGLEAKVSYSKVHQQIWLAGQRFRGDNDYPSILRAGLKFTTPSQKSFSLTYTSRSGQPYTRAEGSAFLYGGPIPLYQTVNGARMPPYTSLDASVSGHLHLTRSSLDPLIFAALSNITDHKNPSAQTLTSNADTLAYRYLARRTFLIGLTSSF